MKERDLGELIQTGPPFSLGPFDNYPINSRSLNPRPLFIFCLISKSPFEETVPLFCANDHSKLDPPSFFFTHRSLYRCYWPVERDVSSHQWSPLLNPSSHRTDDQPEGRACTWSSSGRSSCWQPGFWHVSESDVGHFRGHRPNPVPHRWSPSAFRHGVDPLDPFGGTLEQWPVSSGQVAALCLSCGLSQVCAWKTGMRRRAEANPRVSDGLWPLCSANGAHGTCMGLRDLRWGDGHHWPCISQNEIPQRLPHLPLSCLRLLTLILDLYEFHPFGSFLFWLKGSIWKWNRSMRNMVALVYTFNPILACKAR